MSSFTLTNTATEIDSAISRVVSAETEPTSGSQNMVTSGGVKAAIDSLNDREKTIINLRKFREKSITLDELGQKLKISKERVRQIETKALEKLRKAILDISQQDKEFFV